MTLLLLIRMVADVGDATVCFTYGGTTAFTYTETAAFTYGGCANQ